MTKQCWWLGCTLWALAFPAVGQVRPVAPDLKFVAYLREFLGAPETETDHLPVVLRAIDLNGDKVDEIVVHVMGQAWCGSGGCTTMIFQRKGRSYSRIGWIPATYPPIRVLEGRSNGRRNLTVMRRGMAGEPRFDALLIFDGNRYRLRESQAERALAAQSVRRSSVVIDSEKRPLDLYPDGDAVR